MKAPRGRQGDLDKVKTLLLFKQKRYFISFIYFSVLFFFVIPDQIILYLFWLNQWLAMDEKYGFLRQRNKENY